MNVIGKIQPHGQPAEAAELLTLHWDDNAPLQPTSWCIKNVLEDQTVNLMVGASGSGKSFLAIDLGVSVATGAPFFGYPTKKGGVFYVAAEGGYTILRRLRAAKGSYASGRPFTFVKAVADLLTEEGFARFLATAREANTIMLRDHGVPLTVVIIDTLIAAFGSKNWNDLADAMKVMNVLQCIQAELNVTVIGVHHHGKNTDNGPTGSVALTAAPDNVLSVFADRDTNGKVSARHIAFTKIRDGETGFTCEFELASLQIGIQDGEPLYAAYVKPLLASSRTEAIASKRVRSAKPSKGLDILQETFRSSAELNGSDLPNPVGPGTVKAVSIEHFRDEFQKRYRAKPGSSDPIEAARGACRRVLSKIGKNNPIQKMKWDNREWLYEPTATVKT